MRLTDTMAADALAYVGQGYHRFRRYAPRMLRALDIQAAPVAAPLIAAAQLVVAGAQALDRPTIFLRRGSKWHRHLQAQDPGNHRLWEVAVLFHLREAFRSGDIWLTHSRRYADLKNAFVPDCCCSNNTSTGRAFRSGGLVGRPQDSHGTGIGTLGRCRQSRCHSGRQHRRRFPENRAVERRRPRRS